MNGISQINPGEKALENDSWDYQSTLPPKVTQEFKNAYYVNIKGTNTVKVNGLLVLAHEKGFKEFTTELVEAPTQANGQTAIFKARIIGYGWDAVNNCICEVTLESHGDANPGNCNSMVAAHYIRMAETRAIGRLLRNYLNVSVVTLEELDLIVQLSMMNPTQFERMNSICGSYRISTQDSLRLMIESTGKSDINMLTENEAEDYISSLNLFGTSPSNAAPSQTVPSQATPVPGAAQPVQPAQPVVSNTTAAGQPPAGQYNLE